MAVLLSQHHHVMEVDAIPEEVDKIDRRESSIQNEHIEKYLAEKELGLTVTLDGKERYRDVDFVVIAAQTNYDPVRNYFDTSQVETVIDLVPEVNLEATMISKSTSGEVLPFALCEVCWEMDRNCKLRLFFSSEFFRESKVLYDNLYPSRIIAGIPKVIDKPE